MDRLALFAAVGWALFIISPFICRFIFNLIDDKEESE
jgi:hypothetical protein